ncbi:sugar phosphate isomerase/epimerase family protein [Haloterrigena salifodinae]|uniref:Sugar phosphate isomerase/epimerase n=1 Tax=Haloterrigena salifodinae TaxID=2675099 RepID=A0A8T8E837_9EURY|nr:sugar phosphate isomerase/epimerase [Haloterrigena salifodinae]QRV17652.1 sugar phosphate isomerase/epimerase [Haloterrigena salifodinae]
MQLALSTLGCPDWDLERILSVGRDAGYDGVDFRGYRDEIDVTRHPLFTDRADETRSRLESAGLSISALSSSITLCETDDRAAHVAEARRLVEVGDTFDVDRIRVFGGGDPEDRSRAELARAGGETMREILSIDGAENFQWVLEMHDAWTASDDCQQLLDELPADNVGVLWDAAHTIRLADETPRETLDALGDRIEYVHLKDAVYEPDHNDATDDGYVYAVPGEGDLPMADVVAALRERGYDGWLVFEHEKRWHPSIADPDVALPAFVEWFRDQR